MNLMTRHTETSAYRLETQGNGAFLRVTRLEDGASVGMQGDDAAEFLATVESLPTGEGKGAVLFNSLCADYFEF